MARKRFTVEQYNALLDAYASGTLSYSYMGQVIVHRSLSEMEQILARMEDNLFDDDQSPLSRMLVAKVDKGLNG